MLSCGTRFIRIPYGVPRRGSTDTRLSCKVTCYRPNLRSEVKACSVDIIWLNRLTGTEKADVFCRHWLDEARLSRKAYQTTGLRCLNPTRQRKQRDHTSYWVWNSRGNFQPTHSGYSWTTKWCLTIAQDRYKATLSRKRLIDCQNETTKYISLPATCDLRG